VFYNRGNGDEIQAREDHPDNTSNGLILAGVY
jgi:hypothetical protein